ncbi:MAG: hypothetical protein V1820_02165 [archaeon]
MGKIAVGHLWHFYQPPWQTDYWISRISEECYAPVTEWLLRNPEFRVAVNINNSLVRHFERLSLSGIIDNLGSAADAGTVEFTGSSAYHALLPTLLSSHSGGEGEVRRQIELNEEGNRKVFGTSWNPAGFFPPEAAFSAELAKTIKAAGYRFAITDAVIFDSANPGKSIPHSEVGTVEGLPVFFRSGWSNEFTISRPGRKDYNLSRYVSDLKRATEGWFNGKGGHLSLAYDVETIGHHIRPYRERLDEYAGAFEASGIRPEHFSRILEEFPGRPELRTNPGSWSTTKEDIAAGNPFPLWDSPRNPVHSALKEATAVAIESVHRSAASRALAPEEYLSARDKLDRGLQSCKEWWANPPGQYSPANIRAGAGLLFGAIRDAGAALSGEAGKYREIAEACSRKLEEAIGKLGGG